MGRLVTPLWLKGRVGGAVEGLVEQDIEKEVRGGFYGQPRNHR